MSDTPRTDQQAREWDDGFSMPSDLIALARDLERENASLRADKERLDWIIGKAHYLFFKELGSDLAKGRQQIDAARKEAQP